MLCGAQIRQRVFHRLAIGFAPYVGQAQHVYRRIGRAQSVLSVRLTDFAQRPCSIEARIEVDVAEHLDQFVNRVFVLHQAKRDDCRRAHACVRIVERAGNRRARFTLANHAERKDGGSARLGIFVGKRARQGVGGYGVSDLPKRESGSFADAGIFVFERLDQRAHGIARSECAELISGLAPRRSGSVLESGQHAL